jgi:dGTPase
MDGFLAFDYSVTLEGQIVAIADEIAQRQHDLDDGMRDKDLGLKYDDVVKEIKKYIKDILNNSTEDVDPGSKSLLENLNKCIEMREEGEVIFKRNTIIRDVIEYFICDVTQMSFKNIKNNACEFLKVKNNMRFFTGQLITYSKLGKEFDQMLAKYIKNRIVNSNGVNKFDGKANYVIRRLFKAYYSNPRQMSTFALKQLSDLISKNSKIYAIEFSKFKDKDDKPLQIKNISFSNNGPDEVNKLIDYLKLNIDITKELICPGLYWSHLTENDKRLDLTELNKVKNFSVDQVMQKDDNNIKFIKCMLEDHYAFLSTILRLYCRHDG